MKRPNPTRAHSALAVLRALNLQEYPLDLSALSLSQLDEAASVLQLLARSVRHAVDARRSSLGLETDEPIDEPP